MAGAESMPLAERSSASDFSAGMPVVALALLALLASLSGRLLAPALFGAASGIERVIQITQATANLASPIVAVGGVAFTLRAVGVTLTRSSLGIAYRMLVIPAAIATSAMLMAAVARVLEPALVSVLAVSALVTASMSVPIALARPATRAVGMVLALTALSGAFDFAGVRLSLWAVDRVSNTAFRVASLLVTCGFALEVLLVAVAFTCLGYRKPVRTAVFTAATIALTLLVAWIVHVGRQPYADTGPIVVARAVAELLRPPAPLVPSAVRLTLEMASLVATVAALWLARRSPAAALVALCLLARGALDVPIPALLLVVASIAIPAYAPRADDPPSGEPGLPPVPDRL
jgi:hypothetical protein